MYSQKRALDEENISYVAYYYFAPFGVKKSLLDLLIHCACVCDAG